MEIVRRVFTTYSNSSLISFLVSNYQAPQKKAVTTAHSVFLLTAGLPETYSAASSYICGINHLSTDLKVPPAQHSSSPWMWLKWLKDSMSTSVFCFFFFYLCWNMLERDEIENCYVMYYVFGDNAIWPAPSNFWWSSWLGCIRVNNISFHFFLVNILKLV